MKTQDDIFKVYEGNAYFLRNKIGMVTGTIVHYDWISRMLRRHKLRPKRVLEIGCSNGWRLEKVRTLFSTRCVGVEPSLAALRNGKKLYPKLDLRRGTMSRLPVRKQERFDLVIVSYVFHWVARETLMRSLVEVDRVLKPGGYLLIDDFLPRKVYDAPYHHLPGRDVLTFKRDYASMFAATTLYQILSRETYHAEKPNMKAHIPEHSRAACILLYKNLRN